MQIRIAQTRLAYLSILLCGLVVGGCAAGHGGGVGYASYIDRERQGSTVVHQAVEQPVAEKKNTFAEKYPPELTIYFETDSNALLQNEIVKLDAIAERLTRQPALKLTLNGYSDASGSKHYNRMISESRAMSVKMYLMGKGIDHLRIAIVGHGAVKFVSGNTREEDRRLNRRVEIDIVKTDSKSSMGVRNSF
jgi:outer membrane protein OmpA-like peptidoglycan-associated protein